MTEIAPTAETLPPSPPARQRQKLIRWPDVVEITSLSRAKLTREIRAGNFPQPIQLGPKSVAFVEQQVLDWLDGLPRGLSEKPTKALDARHPRNGR